MKYLNTLTFAAVLAFAAGAAAQAVQSNANPANVGQHYFVDNDGDGVCDYYTGTSDGTGNRQVARRAGNGNGPGDGSGICTGTGPGSGQGVCTCNGSGGPGNGPRNGKGPGSGTGTCDGTGPNGTGTCPNQ